MPNLELPPEWADLAHADPALVRAAMENYHRGVKAYGPRLRERSRQQMMMGEKMLCLNTGVVWIEMVPPSVTEPVEIRTYPWGTRVQILGEMLG